MASNQQITWYIEGLQLMVLHPKFVSPLNSIQTLERKLLAARGYLRFMAKAPDQIEDRWAWDDQEIADWYASEAYQTASRIIDNVDRAFRNANAGYHLYVVKKVRTVEDQIRFWKDSKQVWRLGSDLKAKVSHELNRDKYNEMPGNDDAGMFGSYLAKTSVGESILVATPGLSDHGHGNAFDLAVYDKHHQCMAGVGKSWVSTWDGPKGWNKKLKAAIEKAGEGRFKGPLKSPYEPWHYTYEYE